MLYGILKRNSDLIFDYQEYFKLNVDYRFDCGHRWQYTSDTSLHICDVYKKNNLWIVEN